MLISEFNYYNQVKYSLLVSKLYMSISNYKIVRLFLFFILKQENLYKLIFFFILTCIFLKDAPSVLKKKKKFKVDFLGFYYKKGLDFLYNLILLHVSALYFIFEVSTNYFNNESYSLFNNVPFTYEVDNLCEKNGDFLDYFLSFKLLFFFKFNSKNKKFSENQIRCIYKFPLLYV
jgi:hypothetical protein